MLIAQRQSGGDLLSSDNNFFCAEERNVINPKPTSPLSHALAG